MKIEATTDSGRQKNIQHCPGSNPVIILYCFSVHNKTDQFDGKQALIFREKSVFQARGLIGRQAKQDSGKGLGVARDA